MLRFDQLLEIQSFLEPNILTFMFITSNGYWPRKRSVGQSVGEFHIQSFLCLQGPVTPLALVCGKSME